ncbi:T9SS type A sorting domain-containing protein [uncultured Hymenobacter sp.]|uniref:T9SS type A sorting domain-containing protein n=1 Tax=uncultured Hymenobacter sp. TaxID=170016 RepID=UPI0035CC8F28
MKHVYTFPSAWQLAAFLFLWLIGPAARAQAPAWQTAVLGNGGSSQIAATAADASSNVYVAGSFRGTLVLGSLTLTSAGESDAFVAKWSAATSSFTWAQRAGGPGVDRAYGVAASGANVYVVGEFNGTAGFGAIALVSVGGNDAFVAKLTDTGPSASFTWAQQAGGPSFDQANGVAVSGANVYVVGSVTPPASFGPLTFARPTSSDYGFLASLGDVVLATRTAGPLASLSLWPNPAHAAAAVRIPAVPGAAQATLTLLGALGRTVRTQTLRLPAAGTTAELPVTGLTPGLYHLRVQAGTYRVSQRLTVE